MLGIDPLANRGHHAAALLLNRYRCDNTFRPALRACFDAYNGRKPESAARKAVFRFAKQVAILEDATSAMQWLAACMSGSGKAQV
ncbi:DUF982 domain-containing protein [Mesorhizobium sp. M1027]|uniref:DUF982 domain-containing protein n=1 Tax=Mesorhizobium sp. M1027 TaxID=2957050 RepID=UPI00333AB3E1